MIYSEEVNRSNSSVPYAGLKASASQLVGLELSAAQLEAFAWLARELVDWNRRTNLTAVTDPQGIEVKHFLDSLTCLLAMEGNRRGPLIDVGTGAGFPGLALKIACPSLQVTLVESIGKKVEFCRHVVRSLGLAGVEVIHLRAEVAGRQVEHREVFRWAVARAVAQLPVLVEYLMPLIHIGGCAIAQKGDTGPAEAHAAEKAIHMLGGRLEQLLPIELPGVAERRYLVVIRKEAATPSRFPRRSGIPAKRPLA